jgi:hypothetical protein
MQKNQMIFHLNYYMTNNYDYLHYSHAKSWKHFRCNYALNPSMS